MVIVCVVSIIRWWGSMMEPKQIHDNVWVVVWIITVGYAAGYVTVLPPGVRVSSITPRALWLPIRVPVDKISILEQCNCHYLNIK